MTTFKYRGLSPDGAKVSGVIRAYNEYEAVAQLGEVCPIITNIQEVKEKKQSRGRPLKLKEKELAIMCSQFSIILAAGLPIVRSVEMVAQQAGSKELRNMLLKVAEDVSSGYSLSQGFENNCKTLPVTFVETIRAGEQSGTLEDCFQRLQTYFERSAKTKAKLASTLTYPVMVVCVAIVVFIVVMVAAVPMFVSTFDELGVELPAVTRAMIGISQLVTQGWWLIALVVGGLLAARILVRRDPKGRAMLDKRKLTLSPLKKIYTMNLAAQFASTMAIMLAAGMPIVQCLDITANVVNNGVVSEAIRKVRQGVEQGRELSECMAQSPWFPAMLTEMTGVGEHSGNMEDTLTVIGVYFSNEVELLSNRLLAVLEPVITICLAVFTVGLLMAVYLPMFSMYGGVM